MIALEDTVGRALASAGISPGESILAAVSGGPDSTALLRALAALRRQTGLVLSACVVDHGIRPAGAIASDVEFVRALCARLQVALVEKRVPPGECAQRARASKRSLEEAARDLRHSLLREAARESGAAHIALGHTQDDVIETLLMRVMQGSDVHGLRGIPARRGSFLRPMLACARSQVLAYLDDLGQPWHEDLSNRDTRILRNRVRHRLLPILDSEFPGFRTGLLVLSKKLSLVSDLVRAQGAGLHWTESGRGYSIDAREFAAAEPAVRAWSLLRLYDTFSPEGVSRRLPWRFISPVIRRATLPEEGTILRGHGAVLSARAGRLAWGPVLATGSKKGYFIVVSEARTAEIREAGVRVSFARGPGSGSVGSGGIVILAGKVRPPIVLRSKRKGDFIRLAGGAKSVKNLLIGMKVPESERDRIPILTDRSGVLAVLGGALGYRTRARAGVLAGDRAGVERMVIDVEISMEEGREQQR